MKCPKCGCELAEDHLYCDTCGEEIRIVPDFEPEVEKEMSETLAALFVKLTKEEMPEIQRKSDKEKEKKPDGNLSKKTKFRRIIGAVLGLLLILSVCIGGGFLYRTYSIDYQISRAKEYAAQEKYTQAIGYLEKAHNLEADNAEVLFLMADYYYIQGKYDFAVYALAEIIQSDNLYMEEDVKMAYDKTISVYKGQEDFPAINELLLACDDENIVTMFQQYIAKPPEFSYVKGNYEEVLPLKLSANTSGKIYYTLDGSKPTEKSEIYTAPIFLETGTYIVTAYFVNDYGIESNAVSNTYRIDLVEPSPPEVSVYSGDYFEPYMIEVSVPEDCGVYYTTDSTDPTTDSIPYMAAIPMPLGKSVYKFIALSQEGVTSDITIRTYKLTLDTEISTDMAIMNVIHALMRADVLLDEQGSQRGVSGHNIYKYNSVVRIDGAGDYYIIYEYYEDATGIQTRTDRIYGVSILDGSACRVTYDELGKIVLVPIEENSEEAAME